MYICVCFLHIMFVGICWETGSTSDHRGPSTSIDCDQSSAARGTQPPSGQVIEPPVSGETTDTSKNITVLSGCNWIHMDS